MLNERKTKWEIGATISAGKNAYALALIHRTEIEPRLQPDELEELKSNTAELEARRSGQTERLVDQKSKTIGQGEIISMLHDSIVDLRRVVKYSGSVTPDILKSYGVGEKLNNNISSMVAGANIIISAYKQFTAWSNSVGIIEVDITEMSDIIAKLSQAEEVQDNAMFTRKSKTLDKNVLQRTVEDEVSKISALGQYVFRSKDAAVVKLFEDLIPTVSKAKSDTATEPKIESEENADA